MNLPFEYGEAVDQFVRTCESLGDRVISVLLYGSIARGEVRPGKSDVLDAVVVLGDAIFEDEGEFKEVLGVLVQASNELMATGLPFHPFLYYTLEEFRNSFWNLNAVIWKSDRYSCVLAGRDVRAECGSADNFASASRFAFFGCRRLMQRTSSLIDVEQLDDRNAAKNCVNWFLKDLFKLACLACGTECFYPESIGVLQEILPELDLSSLVAIQNFYEDPEHSAETANDALKRVLALTEALNEQIIRYLQTVSSWSPLDENLFERVR